MAVAPTVSNSISQTSFQTRKVIDSAYRRCRLPAQAITSEMIEIANDQLYLMLSEWTNRGLQLWCIEKILLPLYEAQSQVPLPIGTVELLNLNIRNLQQLFPVSQIGPQQLFYDFVSPTPVNSIGLLWGVNAIPIIVESSQDNIIWTMVLSASPTENQGQWTWLDLEGNIASRYLRIRPISPQAAFVFSQVFLGNTPTEIVMARLNRDDYWNLPNKVFQGRPLQYWFDRGRDIPILHLWPVPSSEFTTEVLSGLRKRYIMDVGTPNQVLDIPQRFYDTAIYGLAARLAQITPQVDANLIVVLDEMAERTYRRALAEENDSAPVYLSPNLLIYTR